MTVTGPGDPAPPGEPLGPRITYIVARLEHAVRKAINEQVRPYGLTALQYTTLSVIGARGGLSNAQLARRAYMTPQAMGEVLEALEAKDMIKRVAHPSHGRMRPAELTPHGREVLGECDAAVGAVESRMLAGLDGGQVAALREGLLAGVRALNAGFPGS